MKKILSYSLVAILAAVFLILPLSSCSDSEKSADTKTADASSSKNEEADSAVEDQTEEKTAEQTEEQTKDQTAEQTEEQTEAKDKEGEESSVDADSSDSSDFKDDSTASEDNSAKDSKGEESEAEDSAEDSQAKNTGNTDSIMVTEGVEKAPDSQEGFLVVRAGGPKGEREPLQYEYESWLSAQTAPVLLEFSADTWGACVFAEQVVGAYAKEFDGKAIILQIKLEDNYKLAKEVGIRAIPTFKIIHKGEVVYEAEGITEKTENEIREKLTELSK